MHPTHEAGMGIAHCIGQNVSHEGVMHRRQIIGLCRQCFAKPGAHILRNRLPHRPLADMLQIVEHIIEHAMSLRAQLGPVFRIKRDAAAH